MNLSFAPPTRARIVAEARSWIGTPYCHQASRKHVGCDCLGLVRGVWRAFYGPEPEAVPPYSSDWAERGKRETLAAAGGRHLVPIGREDFRPGDVILFRWQAHVPAKHAGIVSGAQSFVHAYERIAVTESALSPWWCRRIAYAFCFPGVE